MKKKYICLFIVLIIAGIAMSNCGKTNKVGPSNSMLGVNSNAPAGAGSAVTNSSTTSTSASSTSTSGVVNNIPSTTVSTSSTNTSVSNTTFSSLVNAAISSLNSNCNSTSGSGGTSGGTTGGTTGSTLSVTITSWSLNDSDPGTSGTVTISSGTNPKISWSYSGVSGTTSGNTIAIVVADSNNGSMWTVVTIPASTTSVTYGTAPSGATQAGAAKSLTKGSYRVGILLYNSSSYPIGAGIGTIIVQ